MDVEFVGDVKVSVTTPQHTIEAIEGFDEEIKGSGVNLSKSNIFYINTRSNILDEDINKHYPSISAELLWIMHIYRPDYKTVVYFIWKRIQKATEEEWQKLQIFLI